RVGARLGDRRAARASETRLRSLLPGRQLLDARIRRHRPGPVDRQAARRGARRRRVGRLRSGQGLDLFLHGPARARSCEVAPPMVSFLVERLLAIGALLLASAFFAGSETALFSLSRLQREAMAMREDKPSLRLANMLSHPRRLIVTIIVCNELINIANS